MIVDTVFPRLPAIFALTISFLTSAHTGNATWDQAPTSGDWNTAGNWTPSTVPDGPTDIAAFGTSVQTSVSLSQPIAIGAIIFNAGASAYTITYETNFVFDGAGIINNSGVTQNIVIGHIANPGVTFFNNSASAGISTVFTNSGSILFNNTSTAGQATFINTAPLGGSTNFFNSSTAANATFILGNGGSMMFNDTSTAANGTFSIGGVMGQDAGGGNLYFFGNSSADHGTFTVSGNQFNNPDPVRGFVAFFQNSTASDAAITANGSTVNGALGGLIEFAGSSTAANATLTATGGSNGGLGGAIEFFEDADGGTSRIQLLGNGSLDVSVHNSPSVTVGSIEGSGHVFLGGNELIVGGNGLSTEFSGIIHDGGIGGGSGGSLAVLGTLTLSGANTYSGNTFINSGTLFVNNAAGSGTGTGTVHVNDGGMLGGVGKIAGRWMSEHR